MIALLTLGLYPSSGGPAKSIQAFAGALDARVISWVDPDERAREPLVWATTLEVTGSRWPVAKQLQMPAAGAAAAERLVAQARLVSVHSFWRWHVAWVHRVCRRHGVPYWFVPHGSLDPYVFQGRDAGAKRLFLSVTGRAFLRDAATIVYSTARERDKVTALVGHDRAELIHWPLDPADFHRCDPVVRAQKRAQLGIPKEAVCFLYLGRLTPMKRPIETIAAFARANRTNAHLIVAGNDSGVTADDCRRAAAEHGVAKRTHVVGAAYGADKRALIDAADIYVSLSQRENFNFTAAEALAAGLPLILSPGNDLALDLAGLAGVRRLPDMELDTAAAAMAEAVTDGCPALAAQGAQCAEWALTWLGRGTFERRLHAAADRYARHG